MFFKSASHRNLGTTEPEHGHPVLVSVVLGNNAMINNMLSD